MTGDNSSKLINDIRSNIAHILKQVDDLVNDVEKRISEREADLDEKIKGFEGLKEKEKLLNQKVSALEEERAEVNKQRDANRDKQKVLERQETELNAKLKKVQDLLN